MDDVKFKFGTTPARSSTVLHVGCWITGDSVGKIDIVRAG